MLHPCVSMDPQALSFSNSCHGLMVRLFLQEPCKRSCKQIASFLPRQLHAQVGRHVATLGLDFQCCQARHPHAFLSRRRIEDDSPELFRRLFWAAEIQLQQILGHVETSQASCTTSTSISYLNMQTIRYKATKSSNAEQSRAQHSRALHSSHQHRPGWKI